jgi:hypothetical protein
MSGQGVIVKRCGCVQPGTRRRQGPACPRLSDRGHGSWYFHCSVTTMFGGRERVRRRGYPTRQAAKAARDELLERSRAERRQATHPAKVKPELVADAPSQLWSWDITKIRGPAKGVWYHL